MATSKLFKKVPVTVPNRSGFNMSHNNFFTAPVGTLVPSHIDFLIPGDKIDLSSKLHVQLPPMATDFYGRIEAKEEAFFVPCRILFGGWKDFFVNPVDGNTNPSNIDGQLAKYLIGATSRSEVYSNYMGGFIENPSVVGANFIYTSAQQLRDSFVSLFEQSYSRVVNGNTPVYNLTDIGSTNSYVSFGPGSLADYLGFKVSPANGPASIINSIFRDEIRKIYNKLLNGFIAGLNSEFPKLPENPVDVHWESDIIEIPFRVGNSLKYFQVMTVFDFQFYTGYGSVWFVISSNDVQYVDIKINNILPFMAYHKIYDDWYRAPMIQQSLFKRNVANQSVSTSVANMPWITSGAEDKVFFTGDQLIFANGDNLFDLHQRNWQKDYYTSATPEPQAGEPASVKFEVTDGNGEFTIASLRAANALQQWLDRNNIGGFRYGDLIYAQYGVYPSDAITDRAIYLGSSSVEIYNKSVFQQSGDGGSDTNNPFNAIGSKYSNPMGVGDGSFCNNYEVTEAGFVVKIFSLVPTAYYSTGVRRMFNYNDISDIAFPVLAGVGDQPIYNRELTDVYNDTGDSGVFGYVQRYAEYKFIDDQVHGLLRDGNSLDAFALQRSFTDAPELGSDFLKIPREYLDQVSATKYKLSQYGCWVNCYNSYYKSSTLPAYSIPTLEDMKGHTVLIDKGGKYLD